jgi:hypothetical protein
MVQVPCLEDYLDRHKFTLFTSFLKAKGWHQQHHEGPLLPVQEGGAMVHGQSQQLS